MRPTRNEFASFLTTSLVCLFLISNQAIASDGPDTEILQAQLVTANDKDRFALLSALLEKDRDLSSDDAARYASQAQSMLERQPDNALKADVLNRLSWYQSRKGDAQAGLALADQALVISESLSDKSRCAAAHYHLSLAKWYLSRPDEAIVDGEQSVEFYVAAGEIEEASRSHTLLGAIHRSVSNYDASLAEHNLARDMAEQANDANGIARASNNIGLIHWQLEEHELARDHFESTLAYYRANGTRATLATVLNNLGLIYIEMEQPGRALEFLREGLALEVGTEAPRTHSRLLGNVGYAHEKLGNVKLAFEFYEQTLAIRESVQDTWGMSRALGSIANLHQESGDLEQAEHYYARARDAASAAGARSELSTINKKLAEIYDTQGKPALALSVLKEAHVIDNEINTEETRKKLAELAAARELAEKELELSEQAKQQNTLVFMSALLVLLIVGLLAYGRSRSQLLSSLRQNIRKLEDTTASLSESEQRYRSVFNDAVVPKYLVDIESASLLDANQPALTLAGIMEKESSGFSIFSLQPEWLKEAISDSSTIGNSEARITKEWRSDDATVRYADVWLTPVTVEGRRCALVTVHDSTEGRLLEEDRIRIDKLESLGTLAGGIAHDFNNSLVAVMGRISLARIELGAESEVSSMLVEAEKAIDRSAQLTSSLLAFSKGGEPRRELHDVGLLLSEAATFSTSGAGTKLDLHVADDLWTAEVDINQFKQLVSNLVVNGIHAMKDQGTIRVSASNYTADEPISSSASAGDYIRIDVSDQGPGIPVDVQDKVMDPYFSTKPGGAGLGLASAFAIATRHSGWLSFTSRERSGTVFSVFLPARHIAEPSVPSLPITDITGTERLLVMDDDLAVQSVYREALAQLGYEVVIVSDGEAAIARYANALSTSRPFDLVIMDLTVPGGMGGKAAMDAILKLDPDALGIVASGYSSDPVIATYEQYGFAGALPKPFSLTTMSQLLRRVLISRNKSLKIVSRDDRTA